MLAAASPLAAVQARNRPMRYGLSLGLCGVLAADFVPFGTSVARHAAADDATPSLSAHDGNHIGVSSRRPIATPHASARRSAAAGCVFCASGLAASNATSRLVRSSSNRARNLTKPEERLTHIVVMGMGEPMANLENLVAALDVAGAKDGLGIGARNITISSVGLPVKIRRLAEMGKQYHLAVSLHAPNDAVRTQIVPTNDKTGLGPILEAADFFFAQTGRQVTFEYVLLRGLNDTPSNARELARLLRGRRAHVNLIPFNDVAGLPYRRPTDEALAVFVNELETGGISVKVRKRKGSAIDAACGQLRRQVEQEPGTESALPALPMAHPM